jgi:hypothetical protein
MVKIRDINLSSFTYSHLNKRDDGTIISHCEVVKSNMAANIEAFHNADYDQSDAIFLCCREKIDNSDDYRYTMCTIPTTGYDAEVTNVRLDSFSRLPTIILYSKSNIADVIKRVLNNLIFS